MPSTHKKVSGFSGNEIFCLSKLGYEAGELCLGNSVLALGVLRGFSAGLSNLGGGEVADITRLVRDGRQNAFDRMMHEAGEYGGIGLAGVTFDIIDHVGNLEFIAMGSTIHSEGEFATSPLFSTSADAQALYCQKDSGFTPRRFVFGNVAYSIGVGGNMLGTVRGLARGEVAQFTQIYTKTRHLAISRIKAEAKAHGCNAVIGIGTSITSLLGTQEMMMTGTASTHPLLAEYADNPVTSDLTNEELWNMVNIGYMPIELVMGVSVYSLGLTSGIGSAIKNFVGGEVHTLTDLLYEAREKALERIQADARRCDADKVVGVKIRIYELGGGLVEFMAIGTAVKRIPNFTTLHPDLPPQAIISDRETFVETLLGSTTIRIGKTLPRAGLSNGPIRLFLTIICIILYLIMRYFSWHHS
jgi:uncharacterized protein YbjQ (UPF0145 family)